MPLCALAGHLAKGHRAVNARRTMTQLDSHHLPAPAPLPAAVLPPACAAAEAVVPCATAARLAAAITGGPTRRSAAASRRPGRRQARRAELGHRQGCESLVHCDACSFMHDECFGHYNWFPLMCGGCKSWLEAQPNCQWLRAGEPSKVHSRAAEQERVEWAA